MKIKCSYCGNYLSDTAERCPNCLAPNANLKRVGNEVPQTIDELKEWYVAHNLPDENVTRFFIGKDIKEARAFGIYKDDKTGNFVVYKNKDTGERAIRYEGKDEAYAVNELYMKLKEEILHQKSNNILKHSVASDGNFISNKRNSGETVKLIMILYVVASVLSLMGGIFNSPTWMNEGYYFNNANEQVYYLENGYYCRKSNINSCSWYKYDQENISWSENSDVLDAKEMKHVGYSWNDRAITKYNVEVKKSLKDEEWYKELHPPTPERGYYSYNGNVYYYYNNNWYEYSNNEWRSSIVPSHDVKMDPKSYYDSSATSSDIYSFKDSSYYHNYSSNYSSRDDDYSWSSSSNDSSWDSDYSWDSSDSWDSGSTDWGSDW